MNLAANVLVEMKPTLGLTGLTMHAMALIAPATFLWLAFCTQATTGVTAAAMWLGIFVALMSVWLLLSAMRKWQSCIGGQAILLLNCSCNSTCRVRLYLLCSTPFFLWPSFQVRQQRSA